MSKVGKTTFTKRKVQDSMNIWGKSIQTTYEHFKRLIEAMKEHDDVI